jgi:hypothetical protein
MKKIVYFLFLGILGVSVSFQGGCATDSSVGREAGRGAAYGAIGGAAAGAVTSLIFGGSVVGGMASGAAIGAASGAATGAVSGAVADSDRKKTEAKASEPPKPGGPKNGPDPKYVELQKEIGAKNFEATTLLAECRHREAIGAAEESYAATQDPKLRLYALFIKAAAAEESGNKELAGSIYAKIAQEDPSRGNTEKARSDTLEGIMKIQKIRQEHGLSPLCK